MSLTALTRNELRPLLHPQLVCPARFGLDRSESRTAAEAELLDPVVGFLRAREGIIEAQRPERGFPNQTHTDRAANVHPIVDRTRHRIGDAWAKGRTDTTRNNLASGGECRRPGKIPQRTRIGKSGDFDACI